MMKYVLASLQPLFLLTVLAGCHKSPSVQLEPKAALEMSKQLLSQAAQAHRAAAAVSGQFEHRSHRSGRASTFVGSIQVLSSETSATGRLIRIDGDAKSVDSQRASSHRIVTFDGENVAVFDEESTAILVDSVFRGGSKLFGEKTAGSFSTYFDPESLESLRAYRIQLKNAEFLDGAMCDVLEFPLPNGGAYEMSFGREDHLLRRHTFRAGHDSSSDSEITLFHGIDLNTAKIKGPFTISANGRRYEQYSAGKLTIGQIAPEFSVSSPEGKPLTLSSLRGNVVIVDFWATWCGPCRPAMASLEKLWQEYSSRPVTVMGLTWMDSADPKSFLTGLAITYPTYRGDEIAAAYGVVQIGIPVMFVINKQGRLLDYSIGFRGEASERRLRRIVEAALSEP